MSPSDMHLMRLRQAAETELSASPPGRMPTRSAEALLHELQVHQIELEMQNESLRQAQIDMAANRDRYVDLYDAAPVGYITLNRNGCIEQLNRVAASLLGEDRHALVGRRFFSYVAPADQDRWYLHALRGMRQAEKSSCEIGLGHGTEPLRHIQADCQRVALAEDVYALRVVLVDISERKRAESELACVRSEMQDLLGWQVARHTVAALAHEINQPLSSLSTLCEAVSRMLAADHRGDRVGESVQRMVLEAARAGRVVRELLASLHRPDASGEKMAPATLLQESLRLTQSSGFADCRIFVDCPENLPAVQVKRLHVEKVMLNLIGNSVEAMAEAGIPGGRIWLRAEVVDKDVRITVADAGPGIGTAMAQQMFHPFVTSKASGIGMGLAISRSLVEMQGGRLWFEAQDGPGAIFHFTLPIAR